LTINFTSYFQETVRQKLQRCVWTSQSHVQNTAGLFSEQFVFVTMARIHGATISYYSSMPKPDRLTASTQQAFVCFVRAWNALN